MRPRRALPWHLTIELVTDSSASDAVPWLSSLVIVLTLPGCAKRHGRLERPSCGRVGQVLRRSPHGECVGGPICSRDASFWDASIFVKALMSAAESSKR